MGGKLPPTTPLTSPYPLSPFPNSYIRVFLLFSFLFLFFYCLQKVRNTKILGWRAISCRMPIGKHSQMEQESFLMRTNTRTHTHTHMCVLFGQSCQAAGKQALITKFAQLLDMSSLKWLPNYGRSWLRIVSRRRLIDRVVKCSAGKMSLG